MAITPPTLEQQIEAALCSSQTSVQELLNLILRVSAGISGIPAEGDSNINISVTDASSGPAANAAEVTPDDDTVITNCRSLFVGTGGDLTVTIGGNVVTFANVPDGTWMPIIVTKVMAATTADDIVVVW